MSRFSEYATGVAFQVTLTKAQLRMISMVALNSDKTLAFGWDHGRTLTSLREKGIVEVVNKKLQLTKEGELLLPLLRACGLINRRGTIRVSRMPTVESLRRRMQNEQ